MPIPLLIDCDPGVDDAVAVLMALAAPEVRLLGLTTVFGNAAVDVTTRNARTLLRAGGRSDLPVGRGAAKPLVGAYTGAVPHIHGADGLGDGGAARHADDDRPAETTALGLMRQAVLDHGAGLVILAVGPLTNLALFAAAEPDLARRVGRVVVMGGAALGPGNASMAAEANILNDPEAAEIVFAFDWPVTMIGLDVTEKIVLGPRHLDRMSAAGSAGADLLSRAVPLYRKFYRDFDGIDGIMAHDPAAMAYVLAPELFTTSHWPVRVELAGIGRGCTWPLTRRADPAHPVWAGRPRVTVATDVDGEAVSGLIAGLLS